MNVKGLTLCSRYGYPPNSLHLCGPEKQNDLLWYDSNLESDTGTEEILKDFSTLYPYLLLIAQANDISDPFDPRVVEAYWIGNQLLKNVSARALTNHLEETLQLKKKLGEHHLSALYKKFDTEIFPHHSFHVLNIYHRTGYIEEPHTVATMDACIINSGEIFQVQENSLIVKTKPLKQNERGLAFGTPILRKVNPVNTTDKIFQQAKTGDTISYHWGKLCTILTKRQCTALQFYNEWSLGLMNKPVSSSTHSFAQTL